MVMKNWDPLLKDYRVSRWLNQGRREPKSIPDYLRVRASVSHGEQTGAVVLELEVLIGELVAVN